MLLIVAALALIVQTYQYSLALLFCGYLMYGFIRPKLSRRLRSGIEEEKTRSGL
jgi:CDP-diacylglycerol--serine O-phosphatidyltransferase